jgi:hypothetical protein
MLLWACIACYGSPRKENNRVKLLMLAQTMSYHYSPLHNLTLKVEGIFGMLHIPLSFPLGSREPPKTSLSHTHTHTPLIPSIFSFLLPLSFPHALISLTLFCPA